MTNTKNTKRALLSSVLALFLCFAMLLGTTYAWFTDSVTSANNIIKSGNLDIELDYWDGTAWNTVEGADDIINGDLWEPGYTKVAYLRLRNAGSLALKYQLGVNILSEKEGINQAGGTFKLSDYIEFGVIEGIDGQTAAYQSREAALAAAVTDAKIISEGYTKADSLEANSGYVYLAMVVYMPTDVGNVANHNGTDVPQIDLGINVLATQMTSESDSFGTDYDEITLVANATDLADAITAGKNVMLTSDVALDVNGKAMTIAADADVIIDLNGNDIVGTTTVTGASQILFEVKGELTVVGDGTIALYDKSGAAFNDAYENAAIYVNGGVANLNEGMIVTVSDNAAMAYAADAVGGNSVINVNGATLYSSYIGIRSFPTASGKTNTVNYNSGVVYGGKNGYDIWTQEGSGSSVVNIADGISYIREDQWGGMYYVEDDMVIAGTTAALQTALDSATDGDTIMLVPGVSYGTVYLGRPTSMNDTEMVCDTHSFTTANAEEFANHLADGNWHTTPKYTTTLKNLTVVGAKGATVASVVATSGHVVGPAYDYVLDKNYESGSVYYNTLFLENVKFSNVNFTGKIDINTSDATSVYDGIIFDGCTFTTGGTASTNGAAIRYYNEANNGNIKNIVITNCQFNNCYQGVYVHHVNGITITGSTFDTTGHNAIAIQSHDGAVDLKDVVITGNTFKNIGDRVVRFNEVGADSNITIQSNIAMNSGDEDGEVMKATSIASGVTTAISNNNWNGGTVATDELKDQ